MSRVCYIYYNFAIYTFAYIIVESRVAGQEAITRKLASARDNTRRVQKRKRARASVSPLMAVGAQTQHANSGIQESQGS
eukprot:1460812-Ditylum_brightwellii.AAC.1